VTRSSAQPLVVTSGDFEAPGRTEFVPRALAWASPLCARLARAGIDVEAAPLPAAETHAIVLRRPGLGPRAGLVLEIDQRAIEAALELPVAAPEIEVFRHQLQRASSAERIFWSLAHLPEPFAIALHGDEPVPLSTIDVTALQDLLRRAVEESKRLRIGWHLERNVALSLPPEDLTLADQLEGALAALAVPFALLLSEEAKPPRARLPLGARLFRASLPTDSKGGSADVLGARRPSMRRSITKKTTILVGTRVRIASGPFEGKEAVVQELDGKGGARVRLGLLNTRLDVSELVPEGRPPRSSAPKRGVSRGRRPAIGSSHRRR
jgi:transcription antitermination factor NusG